MLIVNVVAVNTQINGLINCKSAPIYESDVSCQQLITVNPVR